MNEHGMFRALRNRPTWIEAASVEKGKENSEQVMTNRWRVKQM